MKTRPLVHMTVTEIRELVTGCLPRRYEPLNLSFYGQDCRANGDRVVIGDDYGTHLVARLSDGTIHSIDTEEKLPTRFVNSGVQQLARFIEISDSFSDSPITDKEALAGQMKAALAQVDPKAFDQPENWWAVVLEQIACGL